MAEHDEIDPRLDAARDALIMALHKAGRLARAVENLEAHYADREELPGPAHFYVPGSAIYGLAVDDADHDGDLPYPERAVRADAIRAVAALRRALDAAGRAVGAAAPLMDGGGESAHRRWTVLTAGDLRALRSAIVLGSSQDLFPTMLPMPRAGVQQALEERGRAVEARFRQLKDAIYSGVGRIDAAPPDRDVQDPGPSGSQDSGEVADLAANVAKASGPDDVVAGLSWQEAQNKLLGKRERGEPYTSGRKLGKELGCSDGTIRNAIENSDSLKGWRMRGRRGRRAKRASALDGAVLDNQPQSRESDPADPGTEPTDDQTLKRLLSEMTPEEQSTFNAMSPEKKRELLRTYSDQRRDDQDREHKRA